jgi:hypothetical protein
MWTNFSDLVFVEGNNGGSAGYDTQADTSNANYDPILRISQR